MKNAHHKSEILRNGMHSNIKQGRKMGRANLIRVGFDNFTIFEIHFCTVSHDIKHVIETDIILTPFACMIENYTGVMVSYPGVD